MKRFVVLLAPLLLSGFSVLPACGRTVETKTAKGLASVPYVWKNVEIVGGGFVSGIVFSPKQPNVLYARTDIGGAYRWNPDTKRWVPLMDWVGQAEGNLLGVESIAPDPTDANRVYAAAGTYTQSWASNGAILRSTNQGRTWQRTDMPFKMGGNEDGRSIGERLAVDPGKNSVLYFGSRHDGLWRSADYGATWSKVESFPVGGRTNGIGIGFIVFDGRSAGAGQGSQTLYVGVSAPGVNLYRSRNGGKTWEAVPGQPTGLLPHHGVLDKTGALFLTYGNAPGPNNMTDGAVWKYDTGTDMWTNATPVKPGSGGMGTFGYAGLALDPQRPGTLMVTTMDKWSTGDDLFRSTDSGKTWTALKAKSERDSSASPFLNWNRGKADMGHWMGALAMDPFKPGHVLYGTGATIWGSDDANAADKDQPTHWTVRAQGLEETAVIDLISPTSGPHLVSGLGDIGGFRHDDLTVAPRSGIWTNPLLNNTDSLDYASQNPNLMVRVGRGDRGTSGAFSTDGAITWTPFASAPPQSRGGGAAALSADGNTLLWTPQNGQASVSKDQGATWTMCAGLPARVNAVSDRVNAVRFYACDTATGKFYASSDGGMTFTPKAENLPKGRSRIRATSGIEGDLWLAAYDNGLFHSTDGGATFAKLPDVQTGDAIGFGKAATGQTYPALYLTGKVSDVSGVFRSDDGGKAWVRINDNQHQYGWIGQIVTGDPRIYGRVYLGTNGRGILYADPAENGQQK